jgi:hypothetical protein
MGLKQVELVPINSNGPTPLIPAGKPDNQKFFQASRTDTVATLKAVLPAQSSVFQVTLYGSANSNAGTSATGTITISNNTGVISTGTVNLLTGGATTAIVAMSALPNIEPLPLLGDLKITFTYAETGTVSTLGGPWVIGVAYV